MNPWRARLHRWLSPLARRLPLSPNQISILSLGLNAGAAFCLYRAAQRPNLFLLALLLIGLGGLGDALDGIVARTRSQSTRYGDFLDHVLDRVSDAALIVGWTTGSGVRHLIVDLAVIATMLNAYVGTQIEATFRKRNYDSIGRGEFVLALIVYPLISYILFSNGWQLIRFHDLTITEWLTVLMILFASIGIVQRFRLAKKLEKQEHE